MDSLDLQNLFIEYRTIIIFGAVAIAVLASVIYYSGKKKDRLASVKEETLAKLEAPVPKAEKDPDKDPDNVISVEIVRRSQKNYKEIVIKRGKLSPRRIFYDFGHRRFFNDRDYYKIDEKGNAVIRWDYNYAEPIDPKSKEGQLSPPSAELENMMVNQFFQDDTEVAEANTFTISPELLRIMVIMGILAVGLGMTLDPIFHVFGSHVQINWVP